MKPRRREGTDGAALRVGNRRLHELVRPAAGKESGACAPPPGRVTKDASPSAEAAARAPISTTPAHGRAGPGTEANEMAHAEALGSPVLSYLNVLLKLFYLKVYF